MALDGQIEVDGADPLLSTVSSPSSATAIGRHQRQWYRNAWSSSTTPVQNDSTWSSTILVRVNNARSTLSVSDATGQRQRETFGRTTGR